MAELDELYPVALKIKRIIFFEDFGCYQLGQKLAGYALGSPD